MTGLRQFFSYFGSKVALAKNYAPPEFDRIVEPFAGSAGYSCLHYRHSIHLYDVDPTIVGIWEFLIKASERDILGLPLDPYGHSLLSQPEKNFIGFWWRRCGATPSNHPVPWMLTGKYPSSFWSEKTRKRIAGQVDKIKHWKVSKSHYGEIDNDSATWFIDPPYQQQGGRYKFNLIDYEDLSSWAKSRNGNTIVCEAQGATWLPFAPLYENRTVKHKKEKRTIMEMVYQGNSLKTGMAGSMKKE